MNNQVMRAIAPVLPVLLALCAVPARSVHAQDRLKLMPGYDDYLKVQQQVRAVRPSLVSGAVRLGSAGAGALKWSADGKGFDYNWNKTAYHFDLASRKLTELGRDSSGPATAPAPGAAPAVPTGPCSPGPLVVASPDGKHQAIARDRNIFLGDAECGRLTPITTDGNEKDRVKYGTVPWVYGEELDQTTAMWWNQAGTKLAYYRFDEAKIPDFYIAQDQTKLQTKLAVEAYPKPGGPNPIPDLFVYDLATQRSTRIDIRDGKPFANEVLGHYVYAVDWAPGGKELLVSRKSRRQDVEELIGCEVEAGICRVIIREAWPTGWVGKERDAMRWLSDSTRFLWVSTRNGFRNFYLYDITGKLIAPVTQHQSDIASIVRVDEKANTLWYTARDGDNFMKFQLHRVGLDGKNDRRLTDPAYHHQIDLSPDGKYFVDVAETHDRPPFTQVVAVASGKPVGQLARSDYGKLEALGLRTNEVFAFLAADGKTPLLGSIAYPPHFDPAKKYPVIMVVYGGPGAPGLMAESFRPPTGGGMAAYGFLSMTVHTRASQGMGKHSLDALYRKLGLTEIDDMAAGVKALWDRPYFDKEHVGIMGVSYGGYSSLMALLRYPDVFAAAIAASPPTDWRNYDTIYTERYMGLPAENQEGYDKGSALSYVKNLKGDLLIYFGTSDDNVHTTNSMQLIKALQAAGKHFEVRVGPDQGHGVPDDDGVMEFLIHNLVVRPRYKLAY